jgi:aconitate hydratase
MAGLPFHVQTPEVFGVRLTGKLPDWVSAKDVVLEMLRRHGVKGAVGCVLEYYGPGLDELSAMDRHVIANMGTELGATSTLFPADAEVRRFLKAQGREDDWSEWKPDDGCEYDRTDEIDLSTLEPLIAMPSSPDNVRPVREVAGEPIYQAYVGSSANPGYRDFAVAAEIVKGRTIDPRVSFDVNPTSRQLLAELIRDGHLSTLIAAGARLHQAGCNGCIGMGQAPATDAISLRTVPRNFPGRSGTRDDKVCLVSPETAAAAALTGVITDPRTLDRDPPRIVEPENVPAPPTDFFEPPLPPEDALGVQLVKGPNIASLPDFDELPDELMIPVALKVGDNISTDEILPAGSRVLPYRSNIPKIAEFAFEGIDDSYAARAVESRYDGGHVLIGGANYGQGSSREHAALAPRFLGLRAVLAKSFARIHWQNLVNFGVFPLTFADPADFDAVNPGDTLHFAGLRSLSESDRTLTVENVTRETTFVVRHQLSPRQIEVLLAGGLINHVRSVAQG